MKIRLIDFHDREVVNADVSDYGDIPRYIVMEDRIFMYPLIVPDFFGLTVKYRERIVHKPPPRLQ